MNISITSTNT